MTGRCTLPAWFFLSNRDGSDLEVLIFFRDLGNVPTTEYQVCLIRKMTCQKSDEFLIPFLRYAIQTRILMDLEVLSFSKICGMCAVPWDRPYTKAHPHLLVKKSSRWEWWRWTVFCWHKITTVSGGDMGTVTRDGCLVFIIYFICTLVLPENTESKIFECFEVRESKGKGLSCGP